MIYFTSDLHFCHDRGFLYNPRGFNNIDEMNETIVRNWNDVAEDDDDIYVLGDLMMGGEVLTLKAIEYMRQLKGKIHIIIGNHDSDRRLKLYEELPNVVEISYANMIRYQGYKFFISHYPCLTYNLEQESLKQCVLNLFGHTHSKQKFYNDIPTMYNVSLDAHDNRLVSIDTIIVDMKNKMEECISFL